MPLGHGVRYAARSDGATCTTNAAVSSVPRATRPSTLPTAAKAAALAARIGLNAVISRDRPGFIIEALAYAQYNDAVRMFQDGYASPADIDTAMMLGCGYPRGPLQMLDEIGAANVVSVLDAMHAATGQPEFTPVPLLAEYATAGTRFRTSAEG